MKCILAFCSSENKYSIKSNIYLVWWKISVTWVRVLLSPNKSFSFKVGLFNHYKYSCAFTKIQVTSSKHSHLLLRCVRTRMSYLNSSFLCLSPGGVEQLLQGWLWNDFLLQQHLFLCLPLLSSVRDTHLPSMTSFYVLRD